MMEEVIKNESGSRVVEKYFPKQLASLLEEKKYSKIVEICRKKYSDSNMPLSSQIILAKALFKAGQNDACKEIVYKILGEDSKCLSALKILGDLEFEEKNEISAFAAYEKIQKIDPYCRGIVSELSERKTESTQTITLMRMPEYNSEPAKPLREIPFRTETAGDLYMAQGHNRLAVEVFKSLIQRNENPRLKEKLKLAESKIENKG